MQVSLELAVPKRATVNPGSVIDSPEPVPDHPLNVKVDGWGITVKVGPMQYCSSYISFCSYRVLNAEVETNL